MKYMVLLLGDGEERPWGDLDAEGQTELMAKFDAFGQACETRDGVQILAGEALAEGPDATTVAYRSGKQVVTEGPYVEAIEGLGGFYLVEVPHLDVLLELLHELPRYDIQLSPVVDV